MDSEKLARLRKKKSRKTIEGMLDEEIYEMICNEKNSSYSLELRFVKNLLKSYLESVPDVLEYRKNAIDDAMIQESDGYLRKYQKNIKEQLESLKSEAIKTGISMDKMASDLSIMEQEEFSTRKKNGEKFYDLESGEFIGITEDVSETGEVTGYTDSGKAIKTNIKYLIPFGIKNLELNSPKLTPDNIAVATEKITIKNIKEGVNLLRAKSKLLFKESKKPSKED